MTMHQIAVLFAVHTCPSQYNAIRSITFVTDPLTLVQLVSELADVVEWFSLGLHLRIPEPELLKIEAGDRGTSQRRVERCKMAMLIWWLKNGELLMWSVVVKALEKIEMTGLAQKIAIKYGELFPRACDMDGVYQYTFNLNFICDV